MTETTFKQVFSRFLDEYWGAFHEVLEAQSVTPRRLARSLFNALHAEHEAFAAIYSGPAQTAVNGLGNLWADLAARQHEFPDSALTRADVVKGQTLFVTIFDSLMDQGEKYPGARRAVLLAAPHGTPKEPLHADAAR